MALSKHLGEPDELRALINARRATSIIVPHQLRAAISPVRALANVVTPRTRATFDLHAFRGD